MKTNIGILAILLAGLVSVGCGSDDDDDGGGSGASGGSGQGQGGSGQGGSGQGGSGQGGSGQGGSGQGGGPDTGLPDDKPIDQLTIAELQAACEAFADYANGLVTPAQVDRFGCVFTASFPSPPADVAECEQRVAACLESTEPSGTVVECNDIEPVTDCSATVAEFEACSKAIYDSLAELYSYDCEDLVAGANPPGFDEQPPECVQLQMQCPELFDDPQAG